jgi:hypothetical protein
MWSELHPITCVVTGEGREASGRRGTVANLQVLDHLSLSSTSDYSTIAKSGGKSTAARRAARPEHRSRRGSRFSTPKPVDTVTDKRATHTTPLI